MSIRNTKIVTTHVDSQYQNRDYFGRRNIF